MKIAMNATEASTANITHLADCGWDLLTNRGYASKSAQRIIQRRLRAEGYRFFFALPDEGTARWGILSPSSSHTRDDEEIIVGVSLDHCAHQLGMGNASLGWKDFWNWN